MLNKSNKLIWCNLRLTAKTTSLCGGFPSNLIFQAYFSLYSKGFQPFSPKCPQLIFHTVMRLYQPVNDVTFESLIHSSPPPCGKNKEL